MIRFIKTLDVKSPKRANAHDAGVDFFIPEFSRDFVDDFVYKNLTRTFVISCVMSNETSNVSYSLSVSPDDDFNDISIYDILIHGCLNEVEMKYGVLTDDELNNWVITSCTIDIAPHNRVLIPSGIKTWIEPKDSALIATNKSGIATKKGLVVGATTIDADYTGVIHLSVINTNDTSISIACGEKLIQFLHLPVILSEMVEIDNDEYDKITSDSDRGDGGFGSTGTK